MEVCASKNLIRSEHELIVVPQFQMCFSLITDATIAEMSQLQAAGEITAAQSLDDDLGAGTVSADMLTSFRKCDGGVVFSDKELCGHSCLARIDNFSRLS